MERAIAFANRSGETLHGILHVPDARVHAPVGVLLLSPGQKCRLGPWRAYVRLARRLCALGVPVLRFDFHGLGDSEGEHAHGQALVDFNGFVQTGGLASDVVCATEFFARESGVTRFVFAGLCGGAATGLLASSQIPNCYGHVLVDLPVTISSSARQRFLEANPAEMLKLRPEESHGVLRAYLTKALDPGAWWRLLSGGSDYKLLTEAARSVARRALRDVRARLPFAAAPAQPPSPAQPPGETQPVSAGADAATTSPPAAATAAAAEEEVNLPTIEAFRAARSLGQKIFFLNSSAYHPMFHRYFAAQHLPADRGAWRGLGLLVVPETNHVFSPEHSQRAFFEAVEEFVRNVIAEVAERPSVVSFAPPHSTSSPAR
jgi:pimeloyl-ACP methyl ester carboxylesterase